MPKPKPEKEIEQDSYEMELREPRRWLLVGLLLFVVLAGVLLVVFVGRPIFQGKQGRFLRFRTDAAALADGGEFERAISVYGRALALKPGDIGVRRALARCRLQAGDLPEAIAEYRRCLREKPDDSPILLKLASLHLLAKNVERSEELLGAVLEVQPDNVLGLTIRAQCHYERSDTSHPLITLSMITDILPTTSSRYDLLTPSSLATSDPDYEKKLVEAVKANPDEAPPHKNLADYYLQNKRLAEAEQEYKKMVEVAPRDADAYLHLADFYRREYPGRAAEALQQYSRILLTIDPKNLFALRGVSGLSIATGDLAEARRYIDRLLWEHPSDPFGRYFRGIWEVFHGDIGRAESDFLFVTKQESEYAPAHFLLGYTRLLDHEMEEAKKHLDDAARRKPEFARPRLLLAEMAINLGEHDNALKIIDALLADERQKDNPLAYLLRGRVHIVRNNPGLAEEPFTRLAELDTTSVHPRLLLGEIYKRTGKNDEAQAQYQLAIEADPRSALPSYLLGLFYQRTGNPVLSRAHYENAVERDPNFGVAVTSLAGLYVSSLREHADPTAPGGTLKSTLVKTLETRFPDKVALHVTLFDAVGGVFSQDSQFDRAVEVFEIIPEQERDARPHVVYHYARALYGAAGDARAMAERLSGKVGQQAAKRADERSAQARRELEKAVRWLRKLPRVDEIEEQLDEVIGGKRIPE